VGWASAPLALRVRAAVGCLAFAAALVVAGISTHMGGLLHASREGTPRRASPATSEEPSGAASFPAEQGSHRLHRDGSEAARSAGPTVGKTIAAAAPRPSKLIGGERVISAAHTLSSRLATPPTRELGEPRRTQRRLYRHADVIAAERAVEFVAPPETDKVTRIAASS